MRIQNVSNTKRVDITATHTYTRTHNYAHIHSHVHIHTKINLKINKYIYIYKCNNTRTPTYIQRLLLSVCN